MSRIRSWWDQDDWQWPLPCECCSGTDDAMTGVGRRQLCTACRQALALCTMCAAPTLSGEWWCPGCELSMAEYFGEGLVEVL